MKNTELERKIDELAEKVDALLDEIYEECLEEIADDPEMLVGIDYKSYEEMCKFLKTNNIKLMGIT